MKANKEDFKKPEYVRGFVEIFQEQEDGQLLKIFGRQNKILDYGRSIFRKLVAGDGGYKIQNIYYGDGRPLGNTAASGDWPANRQLIPGYDPFSTYAPPVFINVSDPNSSLEDIDFLEDDIMNKIKYYGSTEAYGLYETDGNDMPAFLRFRTRLHNPILFNTSYGDPQTTTDYSYSTETEVTTGTIPTAVTELAAVTQNTEEQDISGVYPKGSFDWIVTFESVLGRNSRAYINGANRSSFIFNEVALGFNPYINDETDLFYSLIAMRYLPDITKVDGLAIIVRWSLIF